MRHEFTAERPSESNPDAGIVEREVTVFDQDDEPVASWAVASLMARRP